MERSNYSDSATGPKQEEDGISRRMSRRDFLKLGAAVLVANALTACGEKSAKTGGTSGASPEHPADIIAKRIMGVDPVPLRNFSKFRAYAGKSNGMYIDQFPGGVSVRDPLGVKEKNPKSADRSSSRVDLLFVPDYDQMPREFNIEREREPAHDSQAMWFFGSGDVVITYLWHDGSTSKISGKIKDNHFTGDEDGSRKLDGPACFQTAHFDGKGQLDHVPEAIRVSMEAGSGTFLQLVTGPTSFDDTDGEKLNDWADQGWSHITVRNN